MIKDGQDIEGKAMIFNPFSGVELVKELLFKIREGNNDGEWLETFGHIDLFVS